jgi:predicted short-subunit dehydrogenase-like oxidoreductase (DUF2520 family)
MKTFSTHKVVLLGAGNVATQLGKALHKSGFLISQVYSPTKKSATALAKKLKSTSISDLTKIDLAASVYIIAVKDDAIPLLAQQLKLQDQLIVHTSGTVEMHVLKGCSKNYGVLYPLQTFSKDKPLDFKNIPLCIEANNKATMTSLEYFAKRISKNVQRINSEQRKILHVAAVFACNFTNHLYAIAASILADHQLSFDLLKPLIIETADKIKSNDPVKMQTGPAVRKDVKTMDAHLKILSKDKKLKTIYKLMSDHIGSYIVE